MSHRAAVLTLLLVSVLAPAARSADPPAVDEGVRLYRAYRYDEARAALTPLATASPANATAVLYMGRIALQKDDPKGASRCWISAACSFALSTLPPIMPGARR